MNALEQQLHYPLGDTLPAQGGALQIAPGVKWIRMVLPFALNHINLWLLEDEMDGPDGPIKGWAVVDCCIARDESRAQWEQVFSNELDGRPILRVIVTHMHPDHIGLAQWLCERWKVLLWISATDYFMARLVSMRGAIEGGDAADFQASHGLSDPQALALMRGRVEYFTNMVAGLPRRFRRMRDGDRLRIGANEWTCISGHGHSPEHIALHCESLGVLISGDMVLPRISTNVSVFDSEPEANPLALFLDSIEKFRALPAGTLTLPAHGKPFKGLHTRIDQLRDHHRDRLAEVMQACESGPQHAADILPVMFHRELDAHQTTFAMGEAIAHLHYLWHAGQLQRRRGKDGVYRYGLVEAPTSAAATRP
ncbi:MAG: MBL fold metallo-hydrolase [Polaromonas sp.]|uniref:MBL fold metallo-hydrolase n=1 Tax=Polaromonas sp. TaxID=1869339 RepID=UPI002733EBAD|nr:MBL fold metallo-hydrolase [Polaromonas sp.]MDP3249503.1 MBL fold metallo-hydrolase [Polaromonas sp.]